MLKYVALFSLILQPCFAYQTHQNVYFAFDVSEDFLNSFKLKNFEPEDIFFIRGYADLIGDESYNKHLSYKRAETVKQELISEYGVEESKIKIFFYGEDKSQNRSNAEKRRAEIISGTASEMESLLKNEKMVPIQSDDITESVKVEEEDNLYNNNYEETLKKDSNSQPVNTTIHDEEEEGLSLNEESNTESFKYSEQEESLGKKERKINIYQNRHYVGLGVYNNILVSTDRGTSNKAKWVSRGNYNIEAQYQLKHKDFWLGVNGSYHIQNYEPELSPTFTWDNKTPSLLQFSLVSDYEKNRWGLGFDLDYHQTSFIYENNFQVKLIDVFMLGVSLRAKYKWFETQKWSSRFGLKLSLPLAGSNRIKPKGSLGYIGFIDLKRGRVFKSYNLNLKFKLYYGFKNYKNNQNDQREEIIGLLFSLDSLNWL